MRTMDLNRLLGPQRNSSVRENTFFGARKFFSTQGSVLPETHYTCCSISVVRHAVKGFSLPVTLKGAQGFILVTSAVYVPAEQIPTQQHDTLT